jgi:phage shock protein A
LLNLLVATPPALHRRPDFCLGSAAVSHRYPGTRVVRRPLEGSRGDWPRGGPRRDPGVLPRSPAGRSPGRQGGIADLTIQRKRLESRRTRLEDAVEKHETQTRRALDHDRDDLARRALEKKRAKSTQVAELDRRIEELETTQQQLVEKKERLGERVERLRTRKETLKARHRAAEASIRVSEAVTGAGDELGDVDRAIRRAEDRTRELEARSAALDELETEGVLEDHLADGTSLEKELADVTDGGEVDAELAALKASVDGETADGSA